MTQDAAPAPAADADDSGTLGKIAARLGPRQATALVLLAGLLVFSPAIRAPLFLDDFLHDAMVRGDFPAPRSPFDLYDFVADDNRAALAARGLLPWFSHPELKIRFFRPLASVLLWVDHRVFGLSALGPHLHSVAWWIATVLVARVFFTHLLPRRPAFVATAIFALSPAHFLPLAWSANREALISLTCGTLALWAHVRATESTRGFGLRLASFALFVLALLGGGEYALGFGGYVLAFELARKEAPLGRRILALVPFSLPAAAYLVVRGALHYGAAGSGFYSDPFRDPVAFLRVAPYHFVAQLADAWLTFGTHTWQPTWQRGTVVAIVGVAIALLWTPIKTTIAALPERERRSASWLLGGSMLALAPTLAVVPAFRLLGIAMLGVAPIVAYVVDRAWFQPPGERGWRAQLQGLAAIALGFAQLVHGPGMAFLESRDHRKTAVRFVERADWLRLRAGDTAKARLALVRGSPTVFFLPFAITSHGETPARFMVLAETGHVLVLRRDERTFELVAAKDRALTPLGEFDLYRDPHSPIPAGAEFTVPGMHVTVLETNAAGVRRARIVLDEPVDSFTWLDDGYERLEEVSLPDAGNGHPFDG